MTIVVVVCCWLVASPIGDKQAIRLIIIGQPDYDLNYYWSSRIMCLIIIGQPNITRCLTRKL